MKVGSAETLKVSEFEVLLGTCVDELELESIL